METIFFWLAIAGIILIFWLFRDVRVAETKLELRLLERELLLVDTASKEEEELLDILIRSVGGQIVTLRSGGFMAYFIFLILVHARYPGIKMDSTLRRVRTLSPICGPTINGLKEKYEEIMFRFALYDSWIFAITVLIRRLIRFNRVGFQNMRLIYAEPLVAPI